MKQYVKAYSDIYYAQNEMNKMIEKGWSVKNIVMTNGNYDDGVKRNPNIVTEKILVLFEKEEVVPIKTDEMIKGLDV